MLHRAAARLTRNGSICLPSTIGRPLPAARKICPVVGRVQLPSEAGRPSALVAERRKERRPRARQSRDRSASADRESRDPRPDRRSSSAGVTRSVNHGIGRVSFVVGGFEHRGIAFAEPAPDLGGGPAARRREQQKPHAPVNGKDGPPVVESDEPVDRALREEQSPKRRAAVIGGEAGRQHQADASARARERHGALDEQLIPVRMAVGLRRVDAGVAGEAEDRARVDAIPLAVVGGTGVGANHVPRRVADHRVEARGREPRAVRVEEHFGKLELPVKEPP